MTEKITTELFIAMLKSAQANLENNKQSVNDLNVFPVPDGDTGTNMSLTIQYAVKEAVSAQPANLTEAVSATSNGALMGARGNSGVILSQLLRGFSKSAAGLAELGPKDIASCMQGATAMAYKAVMKPTEGTILTVAREMSEFASENASAAEGIEPFLAAIIERGHESLDNTPNLLDVLREAGVVDAGGRGLLFLLEGALAALEGKPITALEPGQTAHETSFLGEMIPDIQSEIQYGYCTEFLIQVSDGGNYEKFLIDKLVKLGDSLLVIQDDGIIKIHVHTNEPWTAMKIASGCGELAKIKIDNMRQQHRDLFAAELKAENTASHAALADQIHDGEEENVHYGYYTIAVASGDGMSAILKDLGVNAVIGGGQTMNPSTEDFLKAIEKADADHYILLPNNKNIILAAEQAAQLSEKSVSVISTRSIPQAISALMEFSSDAALEENISNMENALSTVQSAEITYAVRDTALSGIDVHEGDFIGIVEGELLVSEKTVQSAALAAVSALSESGSAELITLYYGEGVSEEDCEILKASLEESFPDTEIEVFHGGQPVYYYIISAE